MTDVHSRYACEHRLAEEFQRWQRHSQPLSFSIWDIDLFKRINDSYGDEAGDRLLRGVAHLLGRGKRGEEFLARIGREEFVLLLPTTALEAAKAVAEKLRVGIETAAFRHYGSPCSDGVERAHGVSRRRYADVGPRARRPRAL